MTQIATPPEGLQGKELEAWVLGKVAESKEGGEAESAGRWTIADARKVIVARGGRTVNLVM